MTHLSDIQWPQSEKKIARRAFDNAYLRECEDIRKHMESMLHDASDPRDIWRIHDFLGKKRRDTDEKYGPGSGAGAGIIPSCRA